MKKNNKGFTLVELLVVIAIIGILAVVAVPALFKNIEKGKIADLEADISAIRSASLSVYADDSAYEQGTLIGTISGANAAEKTLKELEGLSNPFKAETYSLSGVAPNPLTLTITQKLGSELSEEAFLKLRKDLGENVVPFNNEKVNAVEPDEEGQGGSEEIPEGTKYDPNKEIIIKLINN